MTSARGAKPTKGKVQEHRDSALRSQMARFGSWDQSPGCSRRLWRTAAQAVCPLKD